MIWPIFGTGEEVYMDTRLIQAQSLKTAWVGQHLTPLLGQGGEATGDLLLLSHADLQHLPGFLLGWRATQGGQAKRDSTCIFARPPRVAWPSRKAIRSDRS